MSRTFNIVSIYLSIAMSMTYLPSVGQVPDTSKLSQNALTKSIWDQFPSTRFLHLQYSQMGEYDYTTKIKNNIYEKGRIVSQNRFKIAMNYNLVRYKNSSITASARYKYEHMAFENIDIPSGGGSAIASSKDTYFHYLWISLNYTRNDHLWSKPFVSSISISSDASDKIFGMVYGLYMGSFILKQDKSTMMTAGIVVQTNTNSIGTVLPSFSYIHNFQNSPWMLDIIVPKQVYIRRRLFKQGRLSIGSELEANSFFFKSDFLANSNKLYIFNRNEFKNGAMYEYQINKHFTAYGQSGWIKPLNGTIREKYKSDKLASTSYQGNFYFNVGISYNPFRL